MIAKKVPSSRNRILDMAELPPITQSYTHASLPLSSQRCVNGYVEAQPRDAQAKEPTPVLGHPGIGTFATLGSGPIRGMIVMNGVLYAVSGDKLYSVDSNGTETLLGVGITQLNNVSMAASGFEIVIVNGTAQGWTFTEVGSVFAPITDPDFHPAATVTFIDGYFVLDWLDTNKWFISGLLDATSYAALNFASAESSPDQVKSVISHQGRLLIMGAETTEPWNHTGALSFPFQRFAGSVPKRGIGAPLARVDEDQSIFFFGEDRIFYRLNQLQPVRISTHALETAWQKYTTVSDAFCFSIEWNGHKFIYLQFPSEGKTFGYDIATGAWHERSSYDATGAETHWRANASASAYDKILIGDAHSGQIGYLDDSIFTEFNDPIIMELVWPPVHFQGRQGSMPRFELDMETGVGQGNGQGSDPQIMLDYSDDGGRTFSSPELWETMGKVGEYRIRLAWDRLGSFYSRSMRIRISDPVRRNIYAVRCPQLYFESER